MFVNILFPIEIVSYSGTTSISKTVHVTIWGKKIALKWSFVTCQSAIFKFSHTNTIEYIPALSLSWLDFFNVAKLLVVKDVLCRT